MSKRYSGKSFKDSSVMKKPKLTFKEKRKLKEEKKKKKWKNYLQLRPERYQRSRIGAGEGNWTLDLNVGNVSLYHWATPAY